MSRICCIKRGLVCFCFIFYLRKTNIIRNTERDFRGSFYRPRPSGFTEAVG